MNTTQYSYANAWKRIIARLLDFILISIISFTFSLLFFINSTITIKNIFKPIDNNAPNIDGWRVFGISIFSFLITFFYFCVIPYCTKGLTFFKWVFKIRTFSIDRVHNLFWKILKKEFLIWITYYIFAIVASIIVWASNNTIKAIQAIFSMVPQDNNNLFAWGIFVKTMFSICGVINVILVVYMLFNNNKLAIQDIISKTFVYNYRVKQQSNNILSEITIIEEKSSEQISNQEIIEEKYSNLPSETLINNNNDDEYWRKLSKKSLFNNLKTRYMQVERLNEENKGVKKDDHSNE